MSAIGKKEKVVEFESNVTVMNAKRDVVMEGN